MTPQPGYIEIEQEVGQAVGGDLATAALTASAIRSNLPHVTPDRQPITTMVVDKNALVVHGLVHLLADTDFHIAASGSCLMDLPEAASDNADQLLLLGLGNDTDTLISELRQWKVTHKATSVIVLSERFKIDEALMAMKAGAGCYLVKDRINRTVLLRSLELVLQGTLVLSGQFANEVTQDRISGGPQAHFTSANSGLVPESAAAQSADMNELEGLTDRQRVVLSHLMRGASNKHIANALGIAEATVKVHVKSLLRKIHVNNRTQAAMWGMNAQLPSDAESKDTIDF
ncbi:MAG TPA: response regulator transcription factor [Steroidobacteraceae bacterium]|jgi:two-component system nitrate/nitrite response regulator NarL|nr:response regulator transcription factor [Steroidobacteraceae bacterium]